MGHFVDGVKLAGGSHSLISKSVIKDMIEMAHKHDVYVSTGDWAEHLFRGGPSAFKQYIEVESALRIYHSVVEMFYCNANTNVNVMLYRIVSRWDLTRSSSMWDPLKFQKKLF